MPNKVMRLKKGANLPAFTAQLMRGANPVNLEQAQQIQLVWRPVNDSVEASSAAMTITDAAQGKVEKVWSANELNVNSFKAEIKVQWNDGKIERFPSDGYIYFDVIPTVD
jgi:hypothetical protein